MTTYDTEDMIDINNEFYDDMNSERLKEFSERVWSDGENGNRGWRVNRYHPNLEMGLHWVETNGYPTMEYENEFWESYPEEMWK
jgi:hypothetical protein